MPDFDSPDVGVANCPGIKHFQALFQTKYSLHSSASIADLQLQNDSPRNMGLPLSRCDRPGSTVVAPETGRVGLLPDASGISSL